MDFFSFIWIFGLTVVLPITITLLSLNYYREARRLRASALVGQQDAVIDQHELKDVLLDVAEEAAAPLHERIRAIERVYGVVPPASDISEAQRTIGRVG